MTAPERHTSGSFDDLGSLADLRADADACGPNLGLEDAHERRLARAARLAVGPAPSLHADEQPAEQGKPEVRVSEATARIAAALHFHVH